MPPLHCGTEPDHASTLADDLASPLTPEQGIALRILRELQVPHRVKFTPSQLAHDLGGTSRAWQRVCALGQIEAAHLPGGWVVTWDSLVRFVAGRQNAVERN